MLIGGCGDDQDVGDPGEHEGAQGLVDHGLVVERHQLFADIHSYATLHD